MAREQFEEACVFPIPDDEIGNRIGAAVVPRANVADGRQYGELARALAGRIAPFKLPHLVRVLAELPKNANGKTQRSEVARLVLKQMSQGQVDVVSTGHCERPRGSSALRYSMSDVLDRNHDETSP